MKWKRIRIVILFLLALFCCTACGVTASDGDRAGKNNASGENKTTGRAMDEIKKRGYLRVACKNDVPGFGYYNSETECYEGMEIDLAYDIAAKIFEVSYKEAVEKELVHFQPVKVEEREKVLTDGEADYVIATYTISEERKEKVEFSKSYYTSAVGLMVKIVGTTNESLRNEKIRSIADLDGKKIGVPRGATTRKAFLNYLDKANARVNPMFFEYSSYDDMDKALDKGEIDVFSVDVTILNGYLKSGREILPDRFALQEYGVAADKKKAELVAVADTVIDEMENEKSK